MAAPVRSSPVVGCRRPRLAALGILAAVLLAYANTWEVPFLFDDRPSILANPAVQQPALVLRPDRTTGLTTNGRPVLTLSFALNHALSGEAPWSYHTLNVLIHAAAACLLFGVVRRTLRRRDGPDGRTEGWATGIAAVIALLWALHPLQTESVTYIAQRAESLAGCLTLLTVYAFLRAVEAGTVADRARSRRGWGILAAAAAAVGVATKESVAVTPVLLLLYDRVFLGPDWRATWRERRGLYGGLLVSWLVLAVLLVSTGGNRGRTVGLGLGIGAWEYLRTQCAGIVHYLRLAFWPAGQVFDYGRELAPGGLAAAPAAVLLLGLLGGSLWAWWRRSGWGFLGLAFLLLLAPSSSFLPVVTQTLAEHRMYLPLAAVVAAAVLAVTTAWPRIPWLAWLPVVLALGVTTHLRNETYRSELSLWRDTVAKRPANARARADLGNALLEAGRTAEAIAAYEESLELDPRYPEAQNNLGYALVLTGRPEEAIDHYEAALRLRPDMAKWRTNLAGALAAAGRFSEAAREYATLVEASPANPELRFRLAGALADAGRRAEAVTQYEAALRLAPDHAATHFNLANTLFEMGRLAEAVSHYERALVLAPDMAEARQNLALARRQLGRVPP